MTITFVGFLFSSFHDYPSFVIRPSKGDRERVDVHAFTPSSYPIAITLFKHSPPSASIPPGFYFPVCEKDCGREVCRDCWARLYCSGGCAANAYHATGSVKGVYEKGCDLFKKRMECAIMLAVAKELED